MAFRAKDIHIGIPINSYKFSKHESLRKDVAIDLKQVQLINIIFICGLRPILL